MYGLSCKYNSKLLAKDRRSLGLAICLYLLAAFFSNDLQAETVELKWKDVRGSSGYIVRIQGTDGTMSETRIGTNSVTLDLEPGVYTIRIAGLNKFGKPGPFSDPARVNIEASRETRTIQMEEARRETQTANQPESEGANEEEESPSGYEPPTDIEYPEALVPGLIQYNRGSRYQIYLYNGLLALHAVAGFREMQRGNALSRDPLNDPTNLGLLFSGNSAGLSLFWLRRAEQSKQYDMAQRNQTYLAISAALLYGWHFAELYFFPSLSRSTEARNDPSGLSLALGMDNAQTSSYSGPGPGMALESGSYPQSLNLAGLAGSPKASGWKASLAWRMRF
ncbi:MAG: hypothetical protein KDK25_09765 [Leptospiraceae bacterium]|nr:hypothetical protein [Leptospiraceae bacterium]